MPVAFFPIPHPNETVYSVCGRFHLATRGGAPQDTALLLFGDANAGYYSDVPSCLDHLQSATAGAIQGTEDTLRLHTGLSAHMALMPSTSRISFLQSCRQGKPSIARARSGLNRYVGPQSVLKLCTECTRFQLNAEGVTWWNAFHQLPGVWLCSEHRVGLLFVKASSRKRPQWTLPHQVLAIAQNSVLSVQAQLKMLRLTAVVQWISSNHHLETAVLQVMLKERLRHAGLCASELKWRVGECEFLEEKIHRHYDDLPVPDIQRLQTSNWLRTLLSSDCRHYDPMTWSLALSWHGDVSRKELTNEYFDARARKPEKKLFNSLPHLERRTSAPAHIYQALEASDFKKAALEDGRITEYEIDSWLRRDPELKKAWRRAIHSRTKAESVMQIKTFLVSHPNALRVDILRSCNRAYRWLDAYDPDQLHRLLPWVTPRHRRQLHLPWDAATQSPSESHAMDTPSKLKDAP